MRNQRDQEHHQKNKEQDFGNSRCRDRNAAKSQEAGDQGNNQKNKRVVKHVLSFVGFLKQDWIFLEILLRLTVALPFFASPVQLRNRNGAILVPSGNVLNPLITVMEGDSCISGAY